MTKAPRYPALGTAILLLIFKVKEKPGYKPTNSETT